MATMVINPAAGGSFGKTRKGRRAIKEVAGDVSPWQPSKHKGTKKKRKRR